MRTPKKVLPLDPTFLGYKEAPLSIAKEMARAVPVKDTFPRPHDLVYKTETADELSQTRKVWKRYVIKAHERGHRSKLSAQIKEPTERLNTTIILPKSVNTWLTTKKNRAAFIRQVIVNSFEKRDQIC